MAMSGHPGAGGRRGGVSSLLRAELDLDAAMLQGLSNARYVLIPASPGSYPVVSHFVLTRTAGVAATDYGDGVAPALAILFAAAAGGRVPFRGDEAVYATGVYWSIVSDVLPAAAYVFKIDANHHALRDSLPLVVALGGSRPLRNDPTGTLRVVAYYSLVPA